MLITFSYVLALASFFLIELGKRAGNNARFHKEKSNRGAMWAWIFLSLALPILGSFLALSALPLVLAYSLQLFGLEITLITTVVTLVLAVIIYWLWAAWSKKKGV